MSYCIDSHDLIAQGVSVNKLLLVSAWHEAAAFGSHERLHFEPSVHSWNERLWKVARRIICDAALQGRPHHFYGADLLSCLSASKRQSTKRCPWISKGLSRNASAPASIARCLTASSG